MKIKTPCLLQRQGLLDQENLQITRVLDDSGLHLEVVYDIPDYPDFLNPDSINSTLPYLSVTRLVNGTNRLEIQPKLIFKDISSCYRRFKCVSTLDILVYNFDIKIYDAEMITGGDQWSRSLFTKLLGTYTYNLSYQFPSFTDISSQESNIFITEYIQKPTWEFTFPRIASNIKKIIHK